MNLYMFLNIYKVYNNIFNERVQTYHIILNTCVCVQNLSLKHRKAMSITKRIAFQGRSQVINKIVIEDDTIATIIV